MTACWEGPQKLDEDLWGRLSLEADSAATRCEECHGYGHRISECPRRFPATARCVHCHQDGHRISECPIVALDMAVARESRLAGRGGVRPGSGRRVIIRVTNWRRMLRLLGVGILLGAWATYWWIR